LGRDEGEIEIQKKSQEFNGGQMQEIEYLKMPASDAGSRCEQMIFCFGFSSQGTFAERAKQPLGWRAKSLWDFSAVYRQAAHRLGE
jgi:hypothetical protein